MTQSVTLTIRLDLGWDTLRELIFDIRSANGISLRNAAGEYAPIQDVEIVNVEGPCGHCRMCERNYPAECMNSCHCDRDDRCCPMMAHDHHSSPHKGCVLR